MRWFPSLLLVTACHSEPSPPPPSDDPGCLVPIERYTAPGPTSVLRAVYLVATDTPGEAALERRDTMDRALAALQGWYREAVGGPTFRFEPTRIFPSRWSRDEWDDFGRNGFLLDDRSRTDGCGIWHAAADELGGPRLADAGLPALWTSGVYYLVFGGGGTGGGCGAAGMAAVEEMLADRIRARCPNGRNDACARSCSETEVLTDEDPWCTESTHQQSGYGCTGVGALAHEIGHGFGLPHCAERPSCTGDSIMDLWWEYDRGVGLSAEDRVDLRASPWFAE
jgi:hypothetical protein